MNLQEAYINGFVKRASQYGLSRFEAINLFKQAADPAPSALGAGNDAVLNAAKNTGQAVGEAAKKTVSTNVQAMGQNVQPGSTDARIVTGVKNMYNRLTAPAPAPAAPKPAYVAPTDQRVIDAKRQYASENTAPRRVAAPSPDEMLAGIAKANENFRQLNLARQQQQTPPSAAPQPLIPPATGVYAGW